MSSSKECWAYETFGCCQCGENSTKSHQSKVPRQVYFLVTLKGDPHEVTIVKVHQETLRRERFWIPEGEWFSQKAKSGDFVLLQASEKRHEGLERYGKIMVILRSAADGENRLMWAEYPYVSVSDVKEVYTLDTPGTDRHDDAYSVDKCDTHTNCKKIGIHVSCAALGNPFKIKPDAILPYNSYKAWSCPKLKFFNLKKDHVALTLSIYFHTNSETDISQPEVNLVKVKENYFLGERERYNDDYEELWGRFVGNESLIFERSLHKYQLLFPWIWKEVYLLEQMMSAFRSEIKNRPGLTFITKVWDDRYMKQKFEESLTVFKDLLDMRRDESDKVLVLAGAGLRFKEAKETETGPALLPRKRWCVQENSKDESIVQCTSPMIDILQYVNQQVTIQGLFGSKNMSYSKTELLGILGIRFETPRLQTARVRKLGLDSFELEYPGMTSTPEALYEAPYSLFTQSDVTMEKGKICIVIAGISADEYCNRTIVHLRQKEFKDFLDTRNPKKLDAAKMYEEESPYQKNDADTTFTLQAGAELEIQICTEDAKMNRDLKWRILRIAKNRHLCLTHLNNPELAFKSNREDVLKIIQSTQKTTSCSHDATGFLYRRTIKWKDAYYSGGSFDVSDSNGLVNVGRLLCMRKEVYDKNNKLAYIWCCHGIVSAIEGSKAVFEVCTLSQTEVVTGSEEFCVEFVGMRGIISK